MRNYPVAEYEFNELKKLNAEQWQVDMLKKNPDYTCWGNHEDYMSDDKGGWSSPVEIKSVSELFSLDDLNELVNFYFTVARENHECEQCDGTGLNKESKRIRDDWYDFDRTGRKWSNKINQSEVDALWDAGRLHGDFKNKPTAEQVNIWSQKGMGHDSINHWICSKQRAMDLGVYGFCEGCQDGYVYDTLKAKLGLQMWFLHPRKGCSRGVYLTEIKQDEIPTVLKYLKEAQERNNKKFSKL